MPQSPRPTHDPHDCQGHCQGHSHGDCSRAERVMPGPPVPVCGRTEYRIGGILLAAGKAERMGTCKAVLPLHPASRTTVMSAAAAALAGGCNGPIVVVTGFHADAVEAEAARLGLPTMHNPDAGEGMFSSVQTGVAALFRGRSGAWPDAVPPLDAFFVLPVDIPLIRPASCALLADTFMAHQDALTYPTLAGERGHPPLIRADLAGRILAHAHGSGGLRGLLVTLEAEGLPVREVSVADAGTLFDMDTPQARDEALRRHGQRHVPRPEEMDELFRLADPPPHVRAHGEGVAAVALRMAVALNATRALRGQPPVDTGLVNAAARLHDIAKGTRRHEQAGGRFLERYGFDTVGRIVAAHRDIDPTTVERIAERELVMLADKCVRGTTLVPIAERYDERLREWAHTPDAVRDIGGRKERALALAVMLEAELGCTLATLLGGPA